MGTPGDDLDRGLVGAIDAGIDAAVDWVGETAGEAWDFAMGGDEAPSDPNAGAGGAGSDPSGDGGAEGAGGE